MKRDARVVAGITAMLVFLGVVVQIFVSAANNEGAYFDSATSRVVNIFFFFTVQSNLIVGVTYFLIAMYGRPLGTVFQIFRLAGLAGIAITGVIYHWLLAGLSDLTPWGTVSDIILHTIVPVIAIAGWLFFIPIGNLPWRHVWMALIFPVAWLLVVLIRGPIVDWYPYPFVDVIEVGYLRVALNCVGVGLLFVGVTVGIVFLDRLLARRSG